MKKYITPATIAVLFWGIGNLLINEYYYEYLRYYQYASIIIMIPFAIFNLMKKRREDRVNGTQNFNVSIYRMMFLAVLLIAFFFITKPDQI
jgi:hypothetical protein